MKYKEPNFIYKILHKFYRLAPVSWLISKIVPPIDRFFFKISGKKISFAQLVSGLPVVLVECIGAKSGKLRKVPLIAIPVGENRENLVLIASNFGKPSNPAWYYNLVANPQVSISYKGKTEEYLASEIKNMEEYDKYWEEANNNYSGYNNYKKRTEREHIPIIKLSPMKEV